MASSIEDSYHAKAGVVNRFDLQAKDQVGAVNQSGSASLSDKSKYGGDEIRAESKHPFGKLVIEQADNIKGRNVVY